MEMTTPVGCSPWVTTFPKASVYTLSRSTFVAVHVVDSVLRIDVLPVDSVNVLVIDAVTVLVPVGLEVHPSIPKPPK